MGRTHILRTVEIGRRTLKLVMIDGVGFEVHVKNKGEGWNILTNASRELVTVEAAYESWARELSITLAEAVLGVGNA